MHAAAIYARKSNEQKDRAEESKSVTRQVDNARAFAAKQGWAVAEGHIFVDDGISGAEFEKRPAFMTLMGMLGARAPFQRLVVSEQKSIGREVTQTGSTIQRLAQAGVEVFEYVHGRSLTPKNWMEKVMSAVQSGADEAHLVATSERMHEAHARLARAGHVCGGRKFGYKNVDVCKGEDEHGRPKRAYVERVVDPEQAAVVLRLFQLYDQGLGLRAIAKQLRSEGAVAPKPFNRKPRYGGEPPVAGWTVAGVRAALVSDVYHGVVVWNRWRKRDAVDHHVRPSRHDEGDVVRAVREDLRIVPEDLWTRVQARRRETAGQEVRFASGRLSGRPPKHPASNLLAGLATCGVCGGGLGVDKGGRPKQRVYVYICYQFHKTGACANRLRVPVDLVNESVLSAIEEHALTPEAVEQVIALTERDDVAEQRARLERESKELAKRIDRLAEVIASGGDAPSLVAKVRAMEARQQQVWRDLAALRPVPRLAPAVIADRLAEWRRLLRSSTTQGRAVLQRVIRGRVTFTPRADGSGYDFAATTRFDRLFTGIAVPMPAYIEDGDARGTEHIRLEDTMDGDYGRLLAAAERVSDTPIRGKSPLRLMVRA